MAAPPGAQAGRNPQKVEISAPKPKNSRVENSFVPLHIAYKAHPEPTKNDS